MGRWVRASGALAVAVALGACSLLGREPAPVAKPPPPDDRAPLEWARGEEYFVWIRRSCRTLSIYHRGEWVRTYRHVAFGRAPGAKRAKGDKRTPVGLYRIIRRYPHPRWSRFLLLDYPNINDRENHRLAYAAGRAPAGVGGAIGIHGSDEPILNETGMDWTLGCISLLNRDVEELSDLVPDGTLVLIED